MIKANKKKQGALAIDIEPADFANIAGYLTKSGDTERIKKEAQAQTIRDNIESDIQAIERKSAEIADLKERGERDGVALAEKEKEIAEMPATRVYTERDARADIARACDLPFVKTIRADGGNYIVATTRENSLYTTLDRKYSKGQRWYKAKPYKIALPAYNIRIGLVPSKTCANNNNVLGLKLANYGEDTAHWPEWITRYSHEPHEHWGTRHVRDDGDYNGICLGEYESEVSASFRRSIAEGLTALAVYLQTAGTDSAYIHGRHIWALWLGKREYNTALVPSASEVKKLVPEETDEETDGERYNDEGDRDDEGEFNSNGDRI